MTVTNEIILASIAASFGFTVATGINITYLNQLNIKSAAQAPVTEINNIEKFWSTYNELQDINTFTEVIDGMPNICVIVSDKKICVPPTEFDSE